MTRPTVSEVAQALNAHVTECSEKHDAIKVNTEWIKKRIFRLEWTIWIGGGAIIAFLAKLAFV